MKLLLTNDDGFDAPGLAALRQAADRLGEALVIAPHDHQSGCSHRVTADRPFRIERKSADVIAVHGTPADCVRVGLDRLLPDADFVLSGINAGGNLGADIWYSGTVAAVREAVLHGTTGVALSHYRRKGPAFDWERAVRWVIPLLRDLLSRPMQAGAFWNVNLPHLEPHEPDPEIVFCSVDPSPLPLRFRHADESAHYAGDYHGRRRIPGSDVDVCFSGRIAVTLIRVY